MVDIGDAVGRRGYILLREVHGGSEGRLDFLPDFIFYFFEDLHFLLGLQALCLFAENLHLLYFMMGYLEFTL